MNTEGENHRTPLHEAASSGHASIVEALLVQGGADPCPRDTHDATPYDLAYSEGQEEVGTCTYTYKSCRYTCTALPTIITFLLLPFFLTLLMISLPLPQVMQVLKKLLPEEVRPYSLLHSHSPLRQQMVTSLVFTDTGTLVSGSRDCHVSTPYTVNQLPYIHKCLYNMSVDHIVCLTI